MCVELFIIFPYYPFDVWRACSDIPCYISDFGNFVFLKICPSCYRFVSSSHFPKLFVSLISPFFSVLSFTDFFSSLYYFQELSLDLFLSSFSRFFCGKCLNYWEFSSSNVCIECCKFPSQPCFQLCHRNSDVIFPF